MKHVAVYINAGNDRNGNPRRGWIVIDTSDGGLAFVDEGYEGHSALRRHFSDAREVITIDVTPGTYRDFLNSTLRKNPRRSQRKPFRRVPVATASELEVDVWEERDRLSIILKTNDEHRLPGTIIAEWWDGDARQMFEDGFFSSRNLTNSVIKYAYEVGLVRDPSGRNP